MIDNMVKAQWIPMKHDSTTGLIDPGWGFNEVSIYLSLYIIYIYIYIYVYVFLWV